MKYFLLFSSASLVSYFLAYPVRRLALSLGIVDNPDKRKMHQVPIPLLGGVAIYISFAAVSLLWFWLDGATSGSSAGALLTLLTGSTLILMLGIYDDVRGVRPLVKLAGQTGAALVVVAMGGGIDLFTNPLGDSFHIGWLGVPLAVFWIVSVTNAVNLIDGLDGLAAGIGVIAALGLFAVAAAGNPFVASVTILLGGAILGFLPHNFYPARIFLGDTGSMVIGFTLAVVGLHGSFKATTATVLFLPIIVLGIPIFDTLFAIFRRARRRMNPFKADREHIHHRLVRIGLHHRNVVLVLYFVCIYLALTAYSIAQFPYQTAFLFLVLLTMGGVIGLRALQFVEQRLEEGWRPTAPPLPGRYGKPRITNSASLRAREVSSMVCEVGGFRDDLGESVEIRAVAADIASMLSRRVEVFSVRLERSAPGHFIILIRTAPLGGPLVSLVRDGLAWYLEENRARFGSGGEFPVIRWIRTGSDTSVPEASPSESRRGGLGSGGDPLQVGGRPVRALSS